MVAADTDSTDSAFLEKAGRSIQRVHVLPELDVTDPFLPVVAPGKEDTLSASYLITGRTDYGIPICILDSTG